MVTIEYLLNELRRRKIIFDEPELLRLFFENASDECAKKGLDNRGVVHKMKRNLLRTVRIANEVYKSYDYPIRLYLDEDLCADRSSNG